MKWTKHSIPDQTGRIALITGSNSGLGFESAKALLDKGATVIMGCRSLQKAQTAKELLLQSTNAGSIDLIHIDLADLSSIHKASEELKAKYGRLNLLINNAGVMAPPLTRSNQGLELQFAVNHLGHMALTINLLPILEKERASRVVTVTSGAQFMGQISWGDLQSEKSYNRWGAYSQSKLANVMFALELDARLRQSESDSSSLLAHPGLARTNLQSTSVSSNKSWQEAIAYQLMGPLFQSAKMGSLPQLYAATSIKAKGGQQYGPNFNFRGFPKLCRSAPSALNKKKRKMLWELSEALIEKFK